MHESVYQQAKPYSFRNTLLLLLHNNKEAMLLLTSIITAPQYLRTTIIN